MAIDEAKLRATTDAKVWAEEFCTAFSVYTEEGVVEDKVGLMIGWFANAIETGRQAGHEAGVAEASAAVGDDEVRSG